MPAFDSFGVWEGRCQATWKREFELPWREAGQPDHHDYKVDSDQWVVNKELSLSIRRRAQQSGEPSGADRVTHSKRGSLRSVLSTAYTWGGYAYGIAYRRG